MRSWQFICASGFLCLAIAASAEIPEQIEIIGVQQTNTVADIRLETYSGFEQIVTRADFEDRFVDSGDLVNHTISAQTRRTSGAGSYNAASIRGSTGKQINLYLDGMLLTSPSSGYSRLAGIPVSVIEQVEVYPDFTPAELGDANLGGAINIRTRLPRQGTGARVAVSAGSFNTQQQELAVWHGGHKSEAILAVNHSKSDNDYPIDRDVICDYMTCGSSNKRENAAWRQYSALGKWRQQLGEQHAIHVLLATSDSKNQVPVANNRSSHDARLASQLDQFHLLLESQTDSSHWGTRLYGHQQKEHFVDRTGMLIVGGGSDIKQNQDTLGANLYSRWQLASHQPALTLDISESQSDTDDRRRDQQFSATRQRLALALSDHWQTSHQLAVNAIARSSWIHDSTSNDLENPFGPRCDGDDKSCTENRNRHDSWQTGLAWQNGNWLIKSNIGRMIRPPTLTERFGETGAFLGNAELKAEKSRNLDAGMVFDNRHTTVTLAAFHKKLRDGIFISYDSRGVGRPGNISEAVITGAEGKITQALGRNLALFVGGQWMDSENRSPVKAHEGNKLHGFYHISSQTGIRWFAANHQTDLIYHHDDELYYNATNSVKAPARKLLNASYTWHPGNFSLNISVNNLLDYRYLDFNFMPAQGRSFTTTASYTF